MKAVRSNEPGGPDSLVYQDVPVPAPGDDEVLIAMESCGVNYPDNLVIQDLYQVKAPRPFSPGSEVCGRIVAAGNKVSSLSVGQRVIGRCGWGGMAEYVCVPAEKCLVVRDDMPADDAAAFLFGYATAYHALKDRAHLATGETVLIMGAGGGVGAAAVELAHAMGARVLAAASSDDKIQLARRLGAQAGVVYPRDPSAEQVRTLSTDFKQLAAGAGVDVVYDPVGGPYSEPALRSLNPGGRHLVVGFTAGIPRIPLNLPLLKACQIVGVEWRSFNLREPQASAANARELLDLYDAGKIRPTISRRYPLGEGADAIRHLASRAALGKVVVFNDVSSC